MQGKLTEAEPRYLRALAIFEQTFGPDHPNVATVLKSLTDLLEKSGRAEEATAARARAEGIRKKQH
jgi:hypothetical protein